MSSSRTYLSARMLSSTASLFCSCCFFFQAEDGIRDWSVTGVQTCALPIFWRAVAIVGDLNSDGAPDLISSSGAYRLGNGDGTFRPVVALQGTGTSALFVADKIGRASCRERV